MNTFLQTLRLARQDFFKLRKHRDVPAWSMWVLTLIVSLAWGLGMLTLAALAAHRLASPSWWLEQAPPFLGTTLVVGVTFHTVFSLIERHAPQRFIDWTNGEPGVGVSVFFGLTSMGCVALGLAMAYLLLGGLPGMDRVGWTPNRSWWSVAAAAVFFSVIWGLWAWGEWHEEQLKRQAKEAELKLLQAQIEPHYLFNTLANVRSLIDCDPPQAGELLDAFTDHLRASLGSMRAELVTVEQELELVGHYLKLMQLRMCDRLSFRIEATDDAKRAAVPPLLLQPLVENAIHHGLECQVEPGCVHIRATLVNGMLRIEVQDDGVGLDAPQTRKGNGVATQNIKERLKRRYGERGTLKLTSASPKGTLAVLELPYSTTMPQKP
ncbi:MAG: sensor histidine kinase [Burkholderiales bacterium]